MQLSKCKICIPWKFDEQVNVRLNWMRFSNAASQERRLFVRSLEPWTWYIETKWNTLSNSLWRKMCLNPLAPGDGPHDLGPMILWILNKGDGPCYTISLPSFFPLPERFPRLSWCSKRQNHLPKHPQNLGVFTVVPYAFFELPLSLTPPGMLLESTCPLSCYEPGTFSDSGSSFLLFHHFALMAGRLGLILSSGPHSAPSISKSHGKISLTPWILECKVQMHPRSWSAVDPGCWNSWPETNDRLFIHLYIFTFLYLLPSLKKYLSAHLLSARHFSRRGIQWWNEQRKIFALLESYHSPVGWINKKRK